MSSKRLSTICFEVDFDAPSPSLISAPVGMALVSNLSLEAGHRRVTVFDAADERLLRAGVVVAHRMLDGRGEWYLSAPTWEPRLPSERVEPMTSSGGLPDEFARLIEPIARRAPLESVATLEVSQHDYLLLAENETPMALVTDEMVKVSRDQREASEYRQVTVSPEAAMTKRQVNAVVEAMRGMGAARVEDFPSIQQRLGAPATGMTDFPAVHPLRGNATMEELVTAVFAADLWSIAALLLDAGQNTRPHVAALNAQLESLKHDLRGLAHALAPSWREKMQGLLENVPFDNLSDASSAALDVIDELVKEVRAPKLGDIASEEAAPLLLGRAKKAALIMAHRCDALTVDAPDQAWEAALGAAEILAVSSAVAEPVLGKPLLRMARRVQAITEHLRACSTTWDVTAQRLDGLSVQDAFLLGRQVERLRTSTVAERSRFVEMWPERLGELRELLIRAR